MTRLLAGVMWLLHFLPLRILAAVGDGIGASLFWLIPERRKVVRVNLALCFPQQSVEERERLARAHFRAFGRSFIEHALLWWLPPERLRALVRVEGIEHLEALGARPVILLAPHFVGLDAGGLRLSMDRLVGSMYSRQKDPVFDALLYEGRSRFGAKLFSRQDGFRKTLRAIQSGMPFYYLPDLDFGQRASVFAPFFGVPAATVTGPAFIARVTGAAIVPCVTRMLPQGGYVARLYPAWTGYPSGDEVADARRMLAFIEERVLEMPEQYYWVHKRFKTRPEGEPGVYR
jgi:KDO2-lipid IV(A) lauroyltransferase